MNPPVRFPEKFIIEFLILPTLRKYSDQFPIKLNRQRLAESTDYIQISILAILIAIEELNIHDFSSIDWRNINLLKRIEILQDYFCSILRAEIDKEDTMAVKLALDNDNIYITQVKDEVFWWPEISSKHHVSSGLAIIMLNTITQEQRQKRRVKENQELALSRERLHKHNLAQINLTTELSRDLRRFFSNNPVMLIPDKLPQRIWLKYLAHYLAISSKRYPDYGDVIYEDESLLNNARGIHAKLIESSSVMLGIQIREPHLIPRAHHEIANKAGITNIAIVATNPKRTIPDDWSVEVTKEFALKLLHQIPEFSYIFTHDIHRLTIKHPKISDVTEHPIVYVVNNNDNRIVNNIAVDISKTETHNISQIFNIQSPQTEATAQTKESHPDGINTIIDTVLRTDFTTLIRKTFPEYTGNIQNKTSAPHRLVIKIIIMMLKLGRQDITWSTVKGFIEEYIYGNYERERLAKIDEFNDDILVVDETELTKENASRKVGEYKNIFKIKEKFR